MSELTGRRAGVACRFLNVCTELRLDRSENGVHFAVGAFDNEFDASVGKVADVAGHVPPRRGVSGGVAKADALDVSAEIVRPALHDRIQTTAKRFYNGPIPRSPAPAVILRM